MKTSVTKIMMSFALMGCLIFSASDVMAQGRSRSNGGSTSSRSQSAAVSSPNRSTAPTVTRSSSSNSNVSRSAATPQVNRSSSSSSVNRNSSSSTSTTRRSDATPQVNRSSDINKSSRGSSTMSRRDDNRTTSIGTSSSSNRTGGASTRPGTSTRGNSGSGTTGNGNKSGIDIKGRTSNHISTEAARDNGTSMTQKANPSMGSVSNITKPNGSKPDGNGGKPNGNGGKPDGNGSNGNVKPGNGGKPNGNGGKPGNGGHDGHKPGNGGHDGHKPGNGGHNSFGPKNHYDYGSHHYGNEFSWNYSHHNWSRPLPPPARPYHLSPWAWYRPVIPTGWYPYTGAPVIDRVLGLVFGTLYDVSLDHLYCDGYYINGYADGVIYLRDVPMLNLYWPDVMLNYEYNRLVNAQFVYHSSFYDTSRYNRVYRSLSRIYGTPVYRDGMTISWYGGDSRGYVTLSMVNDIDGYYTTMSIGY